MAYRLFILSFLLLYGQAARAWKPFVRDIYLNDAGTSVRVHDLAIDRHQYMWLATDEGLYRYNGRSFTLLPDSTVSFVTALAVAGNGIWLGYSDGTLAWCDGQQIFPSRIAAPNDQESVSDLLYAPWGLVWSTQGSGIRLHFFSGYTAHLGKEEGLVDDYVYDLEWDVSGKSLLAATDQEIVRIQLGAGGRPVMKSLAHHSSEEGYDKISRCLATARLPGNHSVLLRGSQEGGLWGLRYDAQGNISDSRQVPGSAAFGQINDVNATAGNIFWAATEEGCLLRAGLVSSEDAVFRVTDTFRLPGRKIYKVITDRAGTVWAATSQGLTTLTYNYLEYLPINTHFDLGSAFSLAADAADNLWYTQNEALYSLRASDPTPVLRYTAPATITALRADSRGRLWIGTLGKGLISLDTLGHALPVRNIPSLADGHILSITGNGSSLWVSSLNGVDELAVSSQGTTLVRHHSKRSGIGSDYVYRLYTDRAGRTWMATDGGGISMYDGSRYHHWDSTAGFKSKVVYTVAEDALGQVWAGTLENGLYRYNGQRWHTMNHREGLHDLKISAVAGNATGQVVVVNQGGVDVWNPSSRTFRSFNRRSGLDLDTVSHVLNCIATDRYGQVLTLFEHGLLRIRNMQDADIRPSVVLTGVELFSHAQPLSRHCYASFENYLSFRFEGIAVANPEKLQYRYLLEGHNDQWVATNDESVSFPQLRPGRYVFRVQASLHDSFDEAATATYVFTITSPLWRRPWFIGLVALAVFGLVYWYIRMRERNLRKLSRLQRERMMFEYEHLKSQVNPHFLFNSLNTLVNLIEEDRKAAVDYTVQLSDLYRNMLAHRNRDLIRLSEEWDILEKYLYIQQSRFGQALQLKTNITEELKRNRRIVPLALQLLVENAIKHNIVSRSRPLVISILSDGEELRISNTLQEKAGQEKGAGLGLTNICNRYALITSRPVTYGPSDGEFVVILPLL